MFHFFFKNYLGSGVESSLELLDLERNRLSNISTAAFGQLTGLRYLYLSNNNISLVPDSAFSSFADNLQAVSLSGNRIATFPAPALMPCSKLSHLNLGKLLQAAKLRFSKL
jgi:Leucine-rich repeat (LRR) protein